jgi:hypothetical protein
MNLLMGLVLESLECGKEPSYAEVKPTSAITTFPPRPPSVTIVEIVPESAHFILGMVHLDGSL